MNNIPQGLPPIQTCQLPPDEIKRRIRFLDLKSIAVTLQLPQGLNWQRDRALKAIERYRRFLFLKVTADFVVIPTEEIDIVWHCHILDTRKYQDDCLDTFGFYLHHFPYLGMRDEDDAETHRTLFEKTAALHESTFGLEYAPASAFADVSDEAADCG